MVDIKLKCEAPKRLAGEYSFNSFKGLYQWVTRNFRSPLYANHLVIAVAESGLWRECIYGKIIEVTSSATLGYKAKELAREIELLRSMVGGDRCSKREEDGLKFVEVVDKII